MSVGKLKVGDRVRILSVPGEGITNYTIHSSTVRTYKRLIARRRPVRIYGIDEYGQPWFKFRFRRKNRSWHWHFICIMDGDNNWVRVVPRLRRRSPKA